MTPVVWTHHKTRDEARQLLQSRINNAGINQHVQWKGYHFSASVGWGLVLKLEGEIGDETVSLTHVSGALASTVVAKSIDAFGELFPDGHQFSAPVENHSSANSTV